MRVRLRCLALVGILTCTAALLGGCAATPVPEPTIAASPAADAPVFASDTDALAAANASYAAYLKVLDEVLAGDGSETGRLAEVAVRKALQNETESAAQYFDRKYHSVGTDRFDSLRIQAVQDDGRGMAVVRTYLCADVTGVDVLDSAGASIVRADRPPRYPLEVTFENSVPHSTSLRVSERNTWLGTNFC